MKNVIVIKTTAGYQAGIQSKGSWQAASAITTKSAAEKAAKEFAIRNGYKY